jgi:spermidine synthase
LRIVRTKSGAQIVDGRDVVSELLSYAGPTHGLFDVLAACVAALAPGRRVAVLGFAAGGFVAPLRAMGFDARLDCVDASRDGVQLFRELASDWAGDVRVAHADAAAWLRRQRRRYDVVLEDLSIPRTRRQDGTKPDISVTVLPDLIRQRITPNGVVVTNLIPVPGYTWPALEAQVSRSFRHAAVVHFRDYENRVLVASNRLAGAIPVSRAIRAKLRWIASIQSERVRVRTLATPARTHASRR